MRKLVAGTLAIIMVIAMLVPTFNVFAAEELDKNALQLFLDYLVRMEQSERELGVALIKDFLTNGDKGIDELKETLNEIVTDEQEKSLEKYEYTLADVKKELDRLKGWNEEDKVKLLEYLEMGKAYDLEALILMNEENKVAFTDINDHWAKNSIEFLVKKGIIKGKSENVFDPEGKITRAEFTSLIVRLFELKSQDDKTINFSDVKPGAWYYEEVKAAYDNGIANGLSENSFGSLNNIKREEMITIVIRILEQKEPLQNFASSDKNLDLFSDKGQISNWALDCMSKAVKYGIISGRANNILAPKDNTTRAEAATIIMGLYNIVNK